MIEPRCLLLEPSDWVPNNRSFPVLIYERAFDADDKATERFERAFANAGWKGLWRNGVFDYQHYHTHAHEVLGIARGGAKLLIGGPGGAELIVSAGDCLVLPAGTGHMNLGSTDDFLVVGGYPPGQNADIQTTSATSVQLQAIASLGAPNVDPLYGRNGPLPRLWRAGRQ